VVQAPPTPIAPPPTASVLSKGAVSGQKQKLAQFYSITPDCSLNYKPVVRILKQPSNGAISVEETMDFPNFPKDNIRAICNARRVPVIDVYYTSSPRYLGVDAIAFDEIDSMGNLRKFDMKIDVR
jgi:hypothetical protein